MNALFVCPNLQLGGAERHWSLLVRGLAARGWRPSVLTLDDTGPFFDELAEAGVPVRCARMTGRLDRAGIRRSLRARSSRPDVVVTRGVSAIVHGHLIARLAGGAHVDNEHGPVGRDQGPRREALLRLVGPHVDGVIAISEQQVPGLKGRGVRADRIDVVPNAVEGDPGCGGDDRRAVRAHLGVPDEGFLALMVATLRPQKRAHVFVDAVAIAKRRDPRIHGVIAGGGPLHHQLTPRACAAGVRMLGPRRDIADLMSAADVVCLSSEGEGVPMVILEAMACARPVVATAVGGVPEAVVDGATGLLVAPDAPGCFADALLRLAADPGLARRLGAAGAQRQRERFSAGAMIDGYARALEGAVRRRTSAPAL